MEEIIYIVLGIVWLVISILGNKKKKQAQTTRQQTARSEPQPIEASEPSSHPKSEFEDMLEDFFGTGDTKPKSQSAPPQPVFENAENEAFDDYEPEYESLETIGQEEMRKYKGAYTIDEDYQFSAQTKNETLDDIIRAYQMTDLNNQEEDEKINVVDLDIQQALSTGFAFDARQAIIYSEIINRKYV